MSYQQLRNASIRDVLGTMRRSGLHHCLVVDVDNHHVRGVISSEDVAARLQLEYSIDRAENFVELLRAAPSAPVAEGLARVIPAVVPSRKFQSIKRPLTINVQDRSSRRGCYSPETSR